MGKYIDEAMTLEILNMDTGVSNKPNENWNVVSTKNGDLALVDGKEYIFSNGAWKRFV